MKYVWIVPLALITIIWISGCEKEDTSPNAPGLPEQLYPINTGSRWIYEVETFVNDSLLYRDTDTIFVDSVVVWGGEYWFGFNGEPDVYWRNGVEGVWRLLYGANNPIGVAERYYSYPVEPGEIWFVNTDQDSISVVSVSESVEVSAGIFEGCFYYRVIRQDHSRRASIWIKPGVGMIQESEVLITGSDTLRSTSKLKER